VRVGSSCQWSGKRQHTRILVRVSFVCHMFRRLMYPPPFAIHHSAEQSVSWRDAVLTRTRPSAKDKTPLRQETLRVGWIGNTRRMFGTALGIKYLYRSPSSPNLHHHLVDAHSLRSIQAMHLHKVVRHTLRFFSFFSHSNSTPIAIDFGPSILF
jgi:hypothetical protein